MNSKAKVIVTSGALRGRIGEKQYTYSHRKEYYTVIRFDDTGMLEHVSSRCVQSYRPPTETATSPDLQKGN